MAVNEVSKLIQLIKYLLNNPLTRIKQALRKYWAEFLGTGFLTLIIKMSIGQSPDYAPFAIGFGLVLLVFTWGHVRYENHTNFKRLKHLTYIFCILYSGAHFNPSVTTAFVVVNHKHFPRQNVANIAMYYLSQYLGGLAGGFLASFIGGENVANITPEVNDNVELYQAFFGEVLFTFLLCVGKYIKHYHTMHY